jgi:gluconate 2-dehydrogenase
MKKNVYIARKVPPEVEALISEHFHYNMWEHTKPIPREILLENVANVEGLIVSGGSIDDELLQHAPLLRAVSTISVGYNHFDLEAMKQRNIIGMNTPHVLNDTVADLIFSLILSTGRRIPQLDKYVKTGQWVSGNEEATFGLDVHHKTLGIIGMGGIGQAVAHRGKWGFGMKVLYHNRHPKPEAESALEAQYCSLPELLSQSDYIVMMTPLTADTHHMIGAAQFALMKPTAIFINASRGATVDEAALIAALRNNTIYGAGLDVYDQEPIAADHPLLSLPNVVTLPHIGSATKQTRLEMALLAANNLIGALHGEHVEHVVKELRS